MNEKSEFMRLMTNFPWKHACRCAVSSDVPRRSLYVALVVGTVLNLINQGEAIIGLAGINWLKVALTYCVPYAVCTYGMVSYQLRKHMPESSLMGSSRGRIKDKPTT